MPPNPPVSTTPAPLSQAEYDAIGRIVAALGWDEATAKAWLQEYAQVRSRNQLSHVQAAAVIPALIAELQLALTGGTSDDPDDPARDWDALPSVDAPGSPCTADQRAALLDAAERHTWNERRLLDWLATKFAHQGTLAQLTRAQADAAIVMLTRAPILPTAGTRLLPAEGGPRR